MQLELLALACVSYCRLFLPHITFSLPRASPTRGATGNLFSLFPTVAGWASPSKTSEPSLDLEGGCGGSPAAGEPWDGGLSIELNIMHAPRFPIVSIRARQVEMEDGTAFRAAPALASGLQTLSCAVARTAMAIWRPVDDGRDRDRSLLGQELCVRLPRCSGGLRHSIETNVAASHLAWRDRCLTAVEQWSCNVRWSFAATSCW